MVSHHGRRRWPWILLIVAALIAVTGGTTAAIISYQNSRNAAVAEFRQDLVNAKFAASTKDKGLQVAWKDESECIKKKSGVCKQWKTKSEVDATLVVANCRLQMEREKNVANAKPQPGVTKAYKFDEVQYGSDPDGIDVTSPTNERPAFNKSNPTRADVYRYLKEHKDHGFGCFKPDPGDTP
jgi:hypothetical protein